MRRLYAFLLVLLTIGGGMAPVSFVPNTAAPTHLGDFRQTAQQAGTASRLQSGQGVPFLPDVLTDARLIVLIRFAGWQDVSTDVLHEQPITITPGRPNESGFAPPARATLTLKNPDRRYSQFDPLGPNWPYVRENALLWIKLYVDGQYYTRYYGEIKGFKQGHDTTGNYSVVTVTAASIDQRLGIRTAPLKSAMYRSISKTNPVAYWPIEDGSSATTAASGLIGGPPLSVSAGTVRFGATAGPDGSAALADFSSGGSLSGVVPRGTDVSWRVEFVTKFNTLSATAFAAVLQWYTGGNVALWEIDAASLANGGLSLQYITGIGAAGGPFLSNVAVDDGKWHHIRVTADPSSGNIALVVYLDGVAVITQTIIGAFPNTISGVVVNPTGDATEEVPSLGHLAIWAPWSSSTNTLTAYRGYAGESPRDRAVRICAEEGVPFATVGTYASSATMGAQGVDSLMSILRECELADAGFLYGGLADTLQFQGLSQRYNQASSLTLDATPEAGQVLPPWEPLPDDYGRANRATVQRKNGGTRTATDTDGPLGTNAVGIYDASLPQAVNYASDLALPSRASWEVHKGTAAGFRYPTVALNLRKTPAKIPGWLAVTPGLAITVNPPYPANNPSEDIRLVVEGWTEVLSSVRWEVTANCSRQDIYDVFKVGDTRLGRVDARGSTIAAEASAGATSLSVAKTVGGVWTTTATRPADFPFDVDISGIQVTVTAIVGATSPQTFTVTGVTKNLRVGDAVKLWRPGVVAL